jgi:hypothetical protein
LGGVAGDVETDFREVLFLDEDHEGTVEVGGEGGASRGVKGEREEDLVDEGRGADIEGVGDAVGARGSVVEGGEDAFKLSVGEEIDEGRGRSNVREGKMEDVVEAGVVSGRGLEAGGPILIEGEGSLGVREGEGGAIGNNIGDGARTAPGRPEANPILKLLRFGEFGGLGEDFGFAGVGEVVPVPFWLHHRYYFRWHPPPPL